MATYLVTGGAGFIGSHVVERLVALGHRVRVLDDLSEGRRENLAAVWDRIEFLEGDVRDPEVVRRAVVGVDYVLHQAALRSVPRSVEDPMATTAVNVLGTVNLLQAAREAGVRRVVFASSSSVYGETSELPLRESQPPRPVSPYAVSKLAGEQYCAVFTRLYGMETVSLRYFNVFGPRQDPRSEYAAVIPRFILAALRGEPLEIHGDGLQSRDFTYVENVVEANVRAATQPGIAGEVFNIGCGQRYSVLEVKAHLERIFGRSLPARHTPPRKGDVRHTQADMSKAEAGLGYRPLVSFEEGLRRTVEFFAERWK
ncbi:MAG: SDR family oxidoreductase [Blastocatellia bacterium]|nr:SDR family oxidoreductase [Blastocatellia bacterium]MDW8168846.1 SDR family oxidoreductase [Acidobacteriota bacterium]